jgi:hypothetical protein
VIKHLLTDCKTQEKQPQPAKRAQEPQETPASRTPRFALARARGRF